MKVTIKIILTFVALMLTTPLFALTKEIPIFKIVILGGLVAGITAIWKYNPDKNQETGDNDKHTLDKSNN